jgi:tetratricopeptide (TPR) repeat protein
MRLCPVGAAIADLSSPKSGIARRRISWLIESKLQWPGRKYDVTSFASGCHLRGRSGNPASRHWPLQRPWSNGTACHAANQIDNSRQAIEDALRLFNTATELDPNFAAAYGRAASCYAYSKGIGWFSGTAEEIDEVTRLVKRAVELGKDDAIALSAGGWACAYIVGDFEQGAALIDRALLLNVNLAEAWHFSGWVKNWLGEPVPALKCFARAMRLNPLDSRMAGMRTGTAYAHFLLGRYDEAASWAAVQYNPEFPAGLRVAAASNAMAGRMEQARKAIARLRRVHPTLRVSIIRHLVPHRRTEDLARYEEGLRKAGLPE